PPALGVHAFPYPTLFRSRKAGGGVDVGVVATTAVALSGLGAAGLLAPQRPTPRSGTIATAVAVLAYAPLAVAVWQAAQFTARGEDRKSTRLNSSHVKISY